jgi:hypothetical protein
MTSLTNLLPQAIVTSERLRRDPSSEQVALPYLELELLCSVADCPPLAKLIAMSRHITATTVESKA